LSHCCSIVTICSKKGKKNEKGMHQIFVLVPHVVRYWRCPPPCVPFSLFSPEARMLEYCEVKFYPTFHPKSMLHNS
jgi:hypothetical protein